MEPLVNPTLIFWVLLAAIGAGPAVQARQRYVALSVGAPGGATPIEQREKGWYRLQRDNWKLFREWARNPVADAMTGH